MRQEVCYRYHNHLHRHTRKGGYVCVTARRRLAPRRRPRCWRSPLVVLAGSVVLRPWPAAAARQETIKVGLITKDVTNPFFVKMKPGATAQAKKLGAELIYAAGKNSSDNAESDRGDREHDDRGRQGHPHHRRRREGRERRDREGAEGRCARDRARLADQSPTSAVDALFATNNFNAGVLIGKYARAATKGKTVTIAMLDEHAGSSVGALRHNGFLKGFGIKSNNKQIACVGNGGGNTADRRRRWRTASRRTRTSTSSTRSTSRARRAPGRR